MSRPRVFVAQWMPAIGLDRLRGCCDVDATGSLGPLPRDELAARAARADALVAFVSDYVDAGLVDASPSLRVVASFGKGSDNIDVAACTRRGILVTINPEALTESTADLALGLILAARRNVAAGDRHVRAGRFRGWHPRDLLGREFHGTDLGVVGFGAIGRAIARRALAFGVRVSYCDPVRRPEAEAEMGVVRLELDELLAASDTVVVAADLRPGNRHLIGREAIRRMRPGAVLVNVGRGSLVDEAAAAEALASGALGGFAADVFEFEDESIPGRPRAIHPDLLARADATVLTPHIGTGTVEARDRLAISTVDQLLAALRGEVPTGAVNPEAARRPGA
ncbi:Phosphonate dehydrogenase [Aquisphaera giovannonii]|uniref:Phosphonate dehydrogenase n=1 Tax=Aquisphaera giovannonii TaxID=406548 RepID=A0A5B9W3S5_9BACT|nr:NAD(P)-dependent oxidoreductase [Aquisphaera giovannonii]QEH35242.1 Phosphonate dehydrogenase [Aquisphaera giovannonii]